MNEKEIEKQTNEKRFSASNFFYKFFCFFLSPRFPSNLGGVVEPLGGEPLVDLPQDGPEALQKRRERGEHLGFVVVAAVAVVCAAAAVCAAASSATTAAAAAPGDGREEGRARGSELSEWAGSKRRRRREREKERKAREKEQRQK